MRLHAAWVLAAVLLPGCFESEVRLPGPADAPMTLVLEFTLHGEGESNPGPHCGTARISGGAAVIERNERALDGQRPLLVVLPRLSGGWSSLGSEGYPESLPATILTGIPDETQALGVIGWLDGNATVRGAPVSLPHTFEATDVQGKWNATLTLREGPSRIKTFDLQNCA